MNVNTTFSAILLLSVLMLTLRTQQRKRDVRIVFLGLLSGMLASIEVLTLIPNRRVWVLGLWVLFAVVAFAFLLALIRRSLSVSSKTTYLAALGYPFLVVAGVSMASRHSSQSSYWQYLVDGMSLLAFTAALILDQVMDERATIRADMIRQKEFSERLVNSSRDGIFGVGRDDQIVLWNPAMELISGTSSSAAIGAQVSQVLKHIFPGNGFNPIAEAFLGVETARSWSVGSFTSPGRERVFKGYFSPVPKPTGEVAEVFAIITEVQENDGQHAGLSLDGITGLTAAAWAHYYSPLTPHVEPEMAASVHNEDVARRKY
jgi:PAS domain S-box-containing protein